MPNKPKGGKKIGGCKTYADEFGFTVHEIPKGVDCPHIIGESGLQPTPQKTFEEEVLGILTPPEPPDARFKGGAKGWRYSYNEEGAEYLAKSISALAEQMALGAVGEDYKETITGGVFNELREEIRQRIKDAFSGRKGER